MVTSNISRKKLLLSNNFNIFTGSRLDKAEAKKKNKNKKI